MKLSYVDYIVMIKELMQEVGFGEETSKNMLKELEDGYLSLENISANVAVQCFLCSHQSANSDILKLYLKEYQSTGDVNFGEQ